MRAPERTSSRCQLRKLAPLLLALVLGCASQPPRTSPEQFQAALVASITDAQRLADQGKLPTLQGFVAEIYLGLQRRVPDLPPPVHAFYRALIENAPLADSGRMTLQELLTSADLRQLQAAREWQALQAESERLRWAAAFAAMSQAYRPPAPNPAINCTSSRVGTYTYTNCR